MGDPVEVLRGEANDEEEERMKVLITTTGRSRALVKILEPNDLLLADRDGAVDGPARRGGKTNLIL